MKKKYKLRIPSVLVGIVFVLVILLLIIKGSPFNRAAINQEKVISGENITHINVSTNTGDIQISPYDGEEIRIQLASKTGETLSKRYKLKVKEKKNELTIEANKKKFAQGFVILIKLPGKQYEQLVVEAEAANIDVGKVDALIHNIQTSVGNITVIDADGIINARAKVGNVNLEFQAITNDIVAKTEVGNIIVKTEEAPTALQTTSKTSVGTTTINLPNVNNGSIGTDGPNVDLLTEVGDVSLLLVGED